MNTCSQLCLLLFFFAGYSSVLIVCHIMPQNAIYSSGLDAKARSLAKTWFTWINTPEQNGTAIFLPSQILNFEGSALAPWTLDVSDGWRRMNCMNIGKKHRKDMERPSKSQRKTGNLGESSPHPPLSGQLRWELWHCTSTPGHQDGPSRWWCWYLIKKGTKMIYELSNYQSFSVRTWFPDFKPFQTSLTACNREKCETVCSAWMCLILAVRHILSRLRTSWVMDGLYDSNC